MNKELKKGLIRGGISFGIVFAFGMTAKSAILYPQEFHNGLMSLSPAGLDCGNNQTPQSADAILVPGAGRFYDFSALEFKSVTEQNQRRLASVILYNENPNLYIILLNGKPHRDDKNQGESEIDQLQAQYQELTNSNKLIPKEKIIIEQESLITASNFKKAAEIAKKHNLQSFIVVSNKWHNRAVLFACNHGLKSTFFPAETVIEDHFPYNNGQTDGNISFFFASKEAVEKLFALIDPQGKIVIDISEFLYSHKTQKEKVENNQPSNPFPVKKRAQQPQEIWHDKIVSRNRQNGTIFARKGRK